MTEHPWVAFPEALGQRFPEADVAIKLGLESYLAVCLRSSDDVHLGHLAVLDTRPMEASEEDVAALRIFAARASAELERRNQARALAASRARVIEAADEERRRVGRDLHDGAQQRLLAVSNLLRVARMKWPTRPRDELLVRAEDELAQAHAELRELARGLHPVALRRARARPALESLCQASTSPIEVDVYDGELPLPRRARPRTSSPRSALANTARYAQASRVEVRIAPQAASCTSRSPTTASAAPTSTCGTGLLGLADRVEVLGGRLEVDSPAGGGTRIHASILLARPDMPDRLYFTDSDEANELIVEDPLALLVGFALDQQVTVQKAFAGPLVLRERLGTLEPARVAAADLEAVFRERPAIHRFPGSMARRVQRPRRAHRRALRRRRRAGLDRRAHARGAQGQPRGAAGLRRDEGQGARVGARQALRRRAGRAARALAPDARRRRLRRRARRVPGGQARAQGGAARPAGLTSRSAGKHAAHDPSRTPLAAARPRAGHRHPLHDRHRADRDRRRALGARLDEPRRRAVDRHYW